MDKHTPGPWRTDEVEHDAPYQKIEILAGERGVCTVWIDDTPVYEYNEAQRANAILIKEAPTLLEACRRLVGVMHGLGYENDPTAEFARATIEFATGKYR